MAESESQDQNNPETNSGEERKFTQTDMDKAVTDRLKREREHTDKLIEEAVQKAIAEEREANRIASLQGEEKTKATHEAQLKAKEKENAKLAEELKAERFKSAKMSVAAELARLNLPTDDVFVVNLIGETEEATNQAIQAFSSAFTDAVTKAVNESVNHGAPRVGNGTGTPSWQSEIDKAMRI